MIEPSSSLLKRIHDFFRRSPTMYAIVLWVFVTYWTLESFFLPYVVHKPEYFVELERFIFIVLFILMFVNFSISHVLKHKYSSYHKIFDQVHTIIHEIRDLQSFMNSELSKSNSNFENIDSIFRIRIDLISTHFAQIFSTITGCRMRSCIKLIEIVDGIPYLYTYTRDNDSKIQNLENDRHRRDLKTDSMEKNSDFIDIARKKIRWFFCNDLTKRDNYISTSLRIFQKPEGRMGKIWYRINPSVWPLEYRSSIVWPIRQAASPLQPNIDDLRGFLCVDGPSRNLFTSDIDPHIGAIVADALYHPFREWSEAMRVYEAHTKIQRKSRRVTEKMV